MAQKKYNALEPQVSKWTYIIIGFVIVLIIGLLIGLQPSNQEKIFVNYDLVANDDFTEDHPFYEVSYRSSLFSKGLDKILENEEIVFLYVGYNGCQSCAAHIGAFQKYFFSENVDDVVDRIYYFNATSNEKDFYALYDNVAGIGEETPQLVLIINGEIVKSFTVQSADNTQIINSSVRTFFIDALKEINNA